MRSGGRLWMVTLANREPDRFDEELPMYFRTRDAAESYREVVEGWKAIGQWPWATEDSLIACHAPNDVREHDIAWDEFA